VCGEDGAGRDICDVDVLEVAHHPCVRLHLPCLATCSYDCNFVSLTIAITCALPCSKFVLLAMLILKVQTTNMSTYTCHQRAP
jgi:hypothetical protein